MKNNIWNILNPLQRGILNNLGSIRDLVDQRSEMEKLVEKIPDNEDNREVKIRLEIQIKQIGCTTDKMLDQITLISESFVSLTKADL